MPKPNNGDPTKAAWGAGVLSLVFSSLALPLELCLRRGFGKHYLGWQALGALVMLQLWRTLCPQERDSLLVCFFWFVILLMLCARIESFRLSRRGVAVHTRYNGIPCLAAIFKRTPERRIKGVIEPVCGVVAGLLLMELDATLGSFVFVSAISLVLCDTTIEAVEQARASELNDAMIEQQAVAERFRDMQGGKRS